MRHTYGDITSVKRAKVFHSPREDWAEIVFYTDDTHYHLRYFQAETGDTQRTYMSPEKVAAHLAKFNGLYEEVRDGDNLTIHKDGVLIQDRMSLPGGGTYSRYDGALCACLYSLLGEEFSGYEHNYEVRANQVYDAD